MNILTRILKKHTFNVEEKEAILTAIGVLDWASIGKGIMRRKIKIQKAKRDKSIEW